MYQQQIQGQNQNVLYQNYGVAVAQNPNQVLMNNNQLQYQRQLAQQQALQRNQLQMQNAQRAQQIQNIQNAQNNQILNAQKIQQAQNMPNMYKPQQKLQNNTKIQNVPVQHQMNQQVAVGTDGRKTYKGPIIKNNPQAAQNPIVVQNAPHQTNKNPSVLKATPPGKKQLAVSHNTLTQTTMPEPLNINQQNNNKIQINQQQQHHHHHTNQNQPQNQQLQNKTIMESLKNTAMIPNAQGTQEKPQQNQPVFKTNNNVTKKSATLMTVNSLANIPYNEYPPVQFSSKHLHNISGYGANSYNGIKKNFNEDKFKTIVDEKRDVIIDGVTNKRNISYFGLFDGHGGDKCSIFLKNNMHKILFNSKSFLTNTPQSILESFNSAEGYFYKEAVKNGKLVDKSGSCAVIALFIDNVLYSINLGDSRALYSRSSGQEFFQITRDHKPNDEVEKKRIEKAGGKVYYANKAVVNGTEVTLKEKQFGKGFTFPYRLSPSGLAVSFYI